MINYTPLFVVRNDSDSPMVLLNKWRLVPGEELDLLTARPPATENEVLAALGQKNNLSDALRAHTLTLVRHSLYIQQLMPKTISASLNAQYPLRYKDGLISIDEASASNSGVISPENFVKAVGPDGTVKVWVSATLRKNEGPEIHLPMLADERVISFFFDTAVVRAQSSLKRQPAKLLGLGKSVGLKYITRSRVVLTGELPEDAVIFIQASVRYEDADSISVEGPPYAGSSGEYSRSIQAVTGNIKELQVGNFVGGVTESNSFKIKGHAPAGMSLKVNGDGSFYTDTPIYTSPTPPKSVFDGQVWMNTSVGEQLIWSEQDSKWYYLAKRRFDFQGSQGNVVSAGLPYRVLPRGGLIVGATCESIGAVRLSVAVDGKTVKDLDVSGFNEFVLSLPYLQQSKLRIFQDTSMAANAFAASLYVKEIF
jgi:hypothetical protein